MRPPCSMPRPCGRWRPWTSGGRCVTRPCVLTPHAGEFARLRTGSEHDPGADGDLNEDDGARVRSAAAAAAEWRQVVVLKGANTVIAAPDGAVSIAPFENPAMASGGTGDVLAGTIGALLAQGMAPYDAARLGVYLHGLAGDAVRERIGDAGLLASDLTEALPLGRRRLALIAARQRSGGGSGSARAAPWAGRRLRVRAPAGGPEAPAGTARTEAPAGDGA